MKYLFSIFILKLIQLIFVGKQLSTSENTYFFGFLFLLLITSIYFTVYEIVTFKPTEKKVINIKTINPISDLNLWKKIK